MHSQLCLDILLSLYFQPVERKEPPRYSMLGREESVGVQARLEFSKLREELSRIVLSRFLKLEDC